MIASFRFLFKSIAGYPYGRLLTNVGKALTRSFSGMARDGRALNITQKLSETVLSACKLVAYERPSTKNKAQQEQPYTGALRQLGARVWLRCCACLNGGSVKGASPLVFICPLHIN